jgi:DNA polymerase-3 subunit gamma/tau
MALNCDTRARGGTTPAPGEPCGECPSCERIWSGGTSLDVVEIDAASNRGVDDARDLRERAMYAASAEGRFKVYIVDEAHMLTREAWNALLKILEEPPPRVIFVFATTEPQRITNAAAPVMSRLQRFDFRRVGPRAIQDRLAQVAAAEHVAADPEACALIARVADGGMRDALSVLDQVTAFGEGPVDVARVRDLLGLVGDDVYVEVLDLVAGRRADAVFPFVAKLVEAGFDLVAFADGLGDLWRAVLAVTLGGRPDGVSAALGAVALQRAAEFVPGDALRILRALADVEEPIRRSGNPRLVVETLLVRWALLDRTVDIAAVLESLGPVERGGARPAAVPPRPAPTAPARPSARTMEDHSAAPPPAPASPLTIESLRARWPDVVAAARAEVPLLAVMIDDSEPVAFADGVLQLKPLGRNAMTAEGFGRNRARIEELLGRHLGTPLRLATGAPVGGPAGPAGPAAAPRTAVGERLTAEGAKTERTRALRAKHPALDSAVDALDLELLE